MRIPWKYLGLAGVAGVAATGAVIARRRRAQQDDIEPDELRAKLHERLAETGASSPAPPPEPGAQPPHPR